MAAAQQQQQPPQQEGVIDTFTIEGGEGYLSVVGRRGDLTYSGGMARGKSEGRGTIRCEALGWSIRGAAFRGGAMLPCRAVFAWDSGDAFAGPLAASGKPADNARGAVVRGDGGRFQGTWPANGARNHWFVPLHGAAWVREDGSVHAVALEGKTAIDTGEDGWRPGGAGWVRLGVLTTAGSAGQPPGQVRARRRSPARRPAHRFHPFPSAQTISSRRDCDRRLRFAAAPGFGPRPGLEPGPAWHLCGRQWPTLAAAAGHLQPPDPYPTAGDVWHAVACPPFPGSVRRDPAAPRPPAFRYAASVPERGCVRRSGGLRPRDPRRTDPTGWRLRAAGRRP